MIILEKVRHHGFFGTVRRVVKGAWRKGKIRGMQGLNKGTKKGRDMWAMWRLRNVPRYRNPTSLELEQIERDLVAAGVQLHDYRPSPEAFQTFQAAGWFPSDYHGGIAGAVWHEKLLEHWISLDLLGLDNYQPSDVYVDVAAGTSPWAKALRVRQGLASYAIDLSEIGGAYRELAYYRVENATATTFADASVTGASLHCAYEMFLGDDDTAFIGEAARVLVPGGKVIILPLYMHTHYCAYSTPEYFGKGCSDPTATEYVRVDCKGIPSSRKYDAATLKRRVLDPIRSYGMSYRLLVLRNRAQMGQGIYCHFILEITR